MALEAQRGQDNLPLGVLRSVQYDQGEARVDTGDRLLLYTDGLSEAMSQTADEEFGDKDLPAFLKARANGSLADVRDELIESATMFSGAPVLKDDCTVMVVEVL